LLYLDFCITLLMYHKHIFVISILFLISYFIDILDQSYSEEVNPVFLVFSGLP